MNRFNEISVAFLFAFALVLGGCAVTPPPGAAVSPTNPEANKPQPEDLTGAPGVFAGQWRGPCSHIENGFQNTDCSATLTLKQDTMSTFIMGTLQYSSGLMTSAPIVIHRLDIDGNDLDLNGKRVGKIGQHALMFNDDTLGDFSALLSGKDAMGVNIQQVPGMMSALVGSPVADCSQSYCFSAALRKIGSF